jgi:hypothetical protein
VLGGGGGAGGAGGGGGASATAAGPIGGKLAQATAMSAAIPVKTIHLRIVMATPYCVVWNVIGIEIQTATGRF